MSIDRIVNVHAIYRWRFDELFADYSPEMCYELFRRDMAWRGKLFLCLAVLVLISSVAQTKGQQFEEGVYTIWSWIF